MSDKQKNAKKGEIHVDKASLKSAFVRTGRLFSRYAAVMFFVLVAAVYGFVILRINLLSNVQPSQAQIDEQVSSTPVPRIDPKVAEQLEQLQDNSVNVQTLFQEARDNPFQ